MAAFAVCLQFHVRGSLHRGPDRPQLEAEAREREPAACVVLDVGERELGWFHGPDLARVPDLEAARRPAQARRLRPLRRRDPPAPAPGVRRQGAPRLPRLRRPARGRSAALGILPAPGVPWDEPGLYELEKRALAEDRPLELVLGSAPGWSDPLSRARRAWVERRVTFHRPDMRDEDGELVDTRRIQAARLVRY